MKLTFQSIFQGALSAVGFVERELGYVAQAGTFVRNLEGQLPPATNPKSLYADVLRLLGLGDQKIQQVVSIGGQVAAIGSAITVLEGAEQEFAAGQPVTGSVKIGVTEYDYSFLPRTASQSARIAGGSQTTTPPQASSIVEDPAATTTTEMEAGKETTAHGDELTPVEARTATGGP